VRAALGLVVVLLAVSEAALYLLLWSLDRI